MGSETGMTVSPASLAAAIARVSHALPPKEMTDARPILCGVLLEGGADALRAVACDSYRIAVCPVPVEQGDPSAFGQAVVRDADLPLLAAFLKDAAKRRASVSVGRGEGGTLAFGSPAARLELHPVDGQYPAYRSVVEAAPAGPASEVGIAPGYLGQAGQASKAAMVLILRVGGPTDPVLLEDRESGYVEAIIPIRYQLEPRGAR